MIPYLLILLTSTPISLSSTTYQQSSRRFNSRDFSHNGPLSSPLNLFSPEINYVKEPPDNPVLSQRIERNFVPVNKQTEQVIPDRDAKYFNPTANGLPSGVQVGEISLGSNRLLYTYVNASGLNAAAGIMVAGFILVGGALYLFNYVSGEETNGSGHSFNGFNFNKSDKLPSTEVTYWGNWDGFDVSRKKR